MALSILLCIWIRQPCPPEVFSEVQEMACLKRAGSSLKILLIAAGDVEEMQDFVHMFIKVVSLEEKTHPANN